MKRVREMLHNFLATAVATLREIFDEAAYVRFLSRAGMVSSSESYEEFRRELEEANVRRPKCC